ncbi:MAG: alpha-glucosidase [Clostridia bacterium]|nr:alpha-glucosidase [Clostridia bacterium]
MSDWWKKSVVYQVYPRSFCDSNGDGVGDLRGIIGKLDYIKTLGADVIWLNPIYASPNDDNGSDISDYYAIMPAFGTMAELDELLREAPARGLHILMDLVVNHTSDEHPWFKESRKSKDNPYRDFYIWREGKGTLPPNNWWSYFGGSAWQKCDETGEYYLHVFSRKQPDLNWENPAVRQEVYRIMRFWLDKGVDGFRMDVINYISKVPGLPDGPLMPNGLGDFGPGCINGPRIHEFLQEMNREVLSHYDVMTVGEMPGVSPEQACRYASVEGNELNMVFQFQHMELDFDERYSKWTLLPTPLDALRRNLSTWQTALHGKGWNSLYWNNHDQPRIVSRMGDDSTDALRTASAKMLGTLLHMMQGTPYVYEGEELGMTNVPFTSVEQYRDIDALNGYRELTIIHGLPHEEAFARVNGHSRDNARTPMQWDDSPNAGFTAGEPWIMMNPNYTTIHAAAQINDPDSVFSYYRQLIGLRKQYDIITEGDYEQLLENSKHFFAYRRHRNGQTLTVLCGFNRETIADDEVAPYCTGTQLLCNCSESSSGCWQPFETRVYLSQE